MPKPVQRRPPGKVAASAGIVLPTSPSMPATGLRDYITMYYGPPGVGKTTFIKDFGRVLFLSTDRGTRFMKALRIECLRWERFLDVITALEKPGASDNYDFVCIDHVDDWAFMCEQYVCNKLGVQALTDASYGKGWAEYKKELNKFMQRLKRLNLGLVFTAHEITKTVKVRGMEIDKVMPNISKQAWNAVVPVTDLIGYCGIERIKNPKTNKFEDVRTLRTDPREDLYAKDRTRRVRKVGGYEPLSGQSFIRTFSGVRNAEEGIQEGQQEVVQARKPQGGVGRRGRRARA